MASILDAKPLTLKNLRAAIKQLGKGHDDKPIVVWLPGSRIDLSGTLAVRGGEIWVEGNVREGSALG